MNGERPRLLVSDVDGTLVTPDKTLTPRTLAAVARLDEAGVAFTVISSRPPRGLAAIVRALRLRHPFAAFNGGGLVAPDMTPISAHRLSGPCAARALALLAEGGVDAWVFADGEWFVRDPRGPKVERERMTVGFDPIVGTDFAAVLDRVDKIVGVSDDPARLSAVEAAARAAVGGEASIERSQPYYLDITSPQANKGEAVRELARRMEVDLSRTAVIGDQQNDVAMFRVAGFAIAMGQGPPEVRARADAVTGSNRDEGFADAVDRLILSPGEPSPPVDRSREPNPLTAGCRSRGSGAAGRDRRERLR